VPFGLDLFEQIGMRSFEIASEFHRCLQGFRIYFKTLPQFFRRRIVKKRTVLIQIRHDQFVAQFLIALEAAQSPADDRFVVAQRSQRFQVEQLSPAGLEQGREIAWTVIGREYEWLQRRHFAGIKSALKFCRVCLLFRAIDSPALDSFAQRSFN